MIQKENDYEARGSPQLSGRGKEHSPGTHRQSPSPPLGEDTHRSGQLQRADLSNRSTSPQNLSHSNSKIKKKNVSRIFDPS